MHFPSKEQNHSLCRDCKKMKHNLKEEICINTHLVYFSEEKHLRFFTEQKEQRRDADETLDRPAPVLYKLLRKEVEREKTTVTGRIKFIILYCLKQVFAGPPYNSCSSKLSGTAIEMPHPSQTIYPRLCNNRLKI